MTLRPYQARCIEAARQQYAHGSRAILIVAPTGAGKTHIGCAILKSARGKVLWLTHRQELVDQVLPKLPPGVRVATVQGLLASGERPPADVVVLDEAHHYVAAEWSTVSDYYRESLRIGLTATPERADGTPLGDIFTSLVLAASYSELLAGGWIVPCEVYAPDARRSSLAMSPIDAVAAYGGGGTRQLIVFCKTVLEARAVAAGCVNAACVDGETDDAARKETIASFRAGSLSTLSNVYVLTEGFDAPEAAVCILARGASHASTYLQMVGRVLRSAPRKSIATVVDLCGSINEHGLPTEDREYSLEGKAIRRGAKAPIIWQCKSCGNCLPAQPADRHCQVCKAIIPEPEALRIQRRQLARREHDAVADAGYKAAEWQRYLAKFSNPRQAAVVFKARFGHWPERCARSA